MALTEEQLQAFVPRNYFLKEPYNAIVPEEEEGEEEVTTSYGIPNTNAFTNSGGRGGGALQAGDINFNDFNRLTTENYKRKQPTPFVDAPYNQKIQDKFFGMPTWQQGVTGADAGEYLAAGQDIPLDLTGAGKMKQGWRNTKEGIAAMMGKIPSITGFLNKFGIQNFESLPPLDQAFIKQSSGYTGPTVFGEIGSNMGHSRDIFGKNVESLFGNYAEGVQKDYTKLSDLFSATGKGSLQEKYGVTWDEDEGIFKGANAKKAMDMTKMLRTRLKFRSDQMNEQKNIEADLAARHQKERDFASGDVDTSQQAAADQARVDRAYREETGGHAGSYAPGGGSGEHHADESGSTYTDPFDPGGGEKDGGFIDGSNRRVPFFYGGLARLL